MNAGNEPCSTARVESPIIVFCKMMAVEIDRINGSADAVCNVTDRLVGANPPPPANPENEIDDPDGEYGELHGMFVKLRQAVDRMAAEAGRLSDQV